MNHLNQKINPYPAGQLGRPKEGVGQGALSTSGANRKLEEPSVV